MRTLFYIFLLLGICFVNPLAANVTPEWQKQNVLFIENKGQIGDQFNMPRPDILFGGNDGKLAFHLKKNGISYQQYRVEEWYESPDKDRLLPRTAALTSIYRLDVEWLNCNKSCSIEKLVPVDGLNNYYSEVCPDGVIGVKSYKQLLYKNIYNGIDLKWYSQKGILKYDFIVSPGADYKDIIMNVSGADKIFINENNELEIVTPLGSLIEQEPLVYQDQKRLKAKWQINGSTICFLVDGVDNTKPLIIDPGVRLWGSYYGGTGSEPTRASASDPLGNVYFGGFTNSSGGNGIATVGSHQAIYGGGADNAYIAKFNSAGVRQWGTYYGGNIREFGLYVATDLNGNCALSGYTFGSPVNVISSPGSHQVAYGGGFTDAFVVKFNTSGVRQWGTFYGGPGADQGHGVTFDVSGNLYLAGKTDATTAGIIATTGVHQSVFGGVEDAFLVKFNLTGQRVWGTYLGGTGTDEGIGLCTDKYGNIYMSGSTDNSVPNVIATPGSHQNSFGGGGYDAYVVKFNPNGIRLWGTQYGGNGDDRGVGVAVENDSLHIYISGKTASTNSIGTVGAHQPFYGGGPNDAFLVRFDSTGARKWGTYYGGSGNDDGWTCAVHKTGHVYIAGLTTTSAGTVIATPGSHQPVFGGGVWDAFVVQFDWNGKRMWGSYYGGINDDVCFGVSTDNFYHFYIQGSTDTNGGTSIATPGSHQPSYAGGTSDGFITKFYDCPAPPMPSSSTSSNSLNYCAGSASTLEAIGSGTLTWYASATSTTALGTGTAFITPVLSAGTHSYFVEAGTCTVSERTAITITVNPIPVLNVIANPTAVCAGKNTTLSTSGALSYTWSSGSNTNQAIVSPTSTTIYTVAGTNTFGCVGENTIQINVFPLDAVSLTASTYTSCLVIFGGTPVTLTGSPAGGVYSGPNVSGNMLNPTALGSFNPVYTYTNSVNGCVNSATIAIEVISCMGIEELNYTYNGFSISPNPGNGIFQLRFMHELLKRIEVSDLSGKIIFEEQTKNKQIEVDISSYASGVYLFKIWSDKGLDAVKVIKE